LGGICQHLLGQGHRNDGGGSHDLADSGDSLDGLTVLFDLFSLTLGGFRPVDGGSFLGVVDLRGHDGIQYSMVDVTCNEANLLNRRKKTPPIALQNERGQVNKYMQNI
jgi:hypothetical protein